jgi:IS5 family transposase
MRSQNDLQLSLGESILDPRLFELNEELKKVDHLLDDPELLRPFEACFDETMGRPGTSIPVYLRMMYLKFRWGLSYEELEAEVRERLPWRFFCRLSLMDSVPDATTLIKLNQRFGEERIARLNKILVRNLIKKNSIKARRIRIDSTTIESHISYPTDVGLLHQTVKTLTRTATSLGEKITSHVRSAKRAVARLGASLKQRRPERKREAHKVLKAVQVLAKDTVTQSRAVLQKLLKQRPLQEVEHFKEQVALAEAIVSQTEQKLNGQKSIPERIVSFHDPWARPIRKGKLHKPTEFGRTLLLSQDESGIIVDHQLNEGNPNDRAQLVDAVKRVHKAAGKTCVEVAADKGFYSEDNCKTLHRMKVRRVGIANIGRLRAPEASHQKKPWFIRLQKFRCGIEAAISNLKRVFLLGDVRVRGTPATMIWTSFAIFSYNLWQLI